MVPLDGSAFAERALAYGVGLAKASGGELLLIRVVVPPRYPAEYRHEGWLRAMAEAECYLDGLVGRPVSDVTVKAATYYGDPAIAIVNEVSRRPVDLLVMSTHGRAGLGGGLYGSVAEQVFRHLDVPALIVPPECRAVWPVDRRLRILVPLDGSELAAEVLPPARDLAGVLDAELRFLRVVAPPTFKHVEGYPDLGGVPRHVAVGEAKSYLETLAANVNAEGPTVTTEVVESTDIASTIAGAAPAAHTDVIAMATHGRSGVARLVMGTVAAGTIQRATVPILLVRPSPMHRPLVPPQIIKSAPGVRG
jgi:nucleotide-binding universal stress UspA family protein